MDDPGLDPGCHARALRGLARINRLSLAAAAHAPLLRAVGRRLGRTVRVLDVATGSGDVAVSAVRRAAREGIGVELTLADISPVAAEQAGVRARRAGLDARTLVLDAVEGSLPASDVVLCSLFLHHLSEADAVRLLSNMREAAPVGISVSDLRRSRRGSLLAASVPRVVTRSPVVHTDAVLSARAAFTIEELGRLVQRAGLVGATIRPAFPARMTLSWMAPS
jgi:2-polyprenyl-3-methyl-5-hydroxy-6-metoxy-1,4-benzoquinol methylase